MTPTHPSAPVLTDQERAVTVTVTLPLQPVDRLTRYPSSDAETFVRMVQLGAVPPPDAMRIAATHFLQMALASEDTYGSREHLNDLAWVTHRLSNPPETTPEDQ